MRFVTYRSSTMLDYPHLLLFQGEQKEGIVCRLFVFVSTEFDIEIYKKTYACVQDTKPISVETIKDDEAFAYLLPLLQKERLRLTTSGFPIKK